MDDSAVKRPEFSTEEIRLMIGGVEKWKEVILEKKFSENCSWQPKAKVEIAWERVTDGVNAVSSIQREASEVRKKYFAYRKYVKRKALAKRSVIRRTGREQSCRSTSSCKQEVMMPSISDLAVEDIIVQETKEGADHSDASTISCKEEVVYSVVDDVEGLILQQTKESDRGSYASIDWSAKATLLLIEAYRNRLPELNSGTRKKCDIYNDIAAEIRGKGYSANGLACDAKMRSLKQRYKKIKTNSKLRNRNSNKQWVFYSTMDNLFGSSMAGDSSSTLPLELDISFPSGHDSNADWSTNATLLLIQAYRNHREEFNIGLKKKYAIWEDIAADITDRGYFTTGRCCDTKMRSLKQRYKKIKENVKLRGREIDKQWMFYPFMDDFMSNDPTIQALNIDPEASTSIQSPSPPPSPRSISPELSPPASPVQPPPQKRMKKGIGESDTIFLSNSALDKIAHVASQKNRLLHKFLKNLNRRHEDDQEFKQLVQKTQERQQQQMVEHQEEVRVLHDKIFQLLDIQKKERQEHHEQQLKQQNENHKELREMQKQMFDMQRNYLNTINKLINNKKQEDGNIDAD